MTIDAKLYVKKEAFTLDVEFQLPTKGVTAIFGPSGSGKTTLLRAIAGLDSSKGTLKIGNMVWQNDKYNTPTHKRLLGYVFQEANLFSHLSVHKNLMFGLKRTPKQEQLKLEDVSEFMGIKHLLSRSTKNLSGGEMQRVAIARALLTNPKLLLMDEPLSALDQTSKYEILTVLEKLQRQLGIPTLYVSHSKDEVLRLADNIVLLDKGKVLAYGPISEILTRTDLPLSHAKDAEVIVETTVIHHDKNFQMTHLEFSGGMFLVPLRKIDIGQTIRLRVLGRDISICLTKPEGTSILNIFPASVEEIIFEEKFQATLKIRIGKTIFLSKISKKSAENLKIEVGKKVFAQIKAAALVH